MPRKPSLASLSINAGAPLPENGRAFRHGPEFASTFHLSGDVDPNAYQYGRFGQPTWTSLEQGLAQLEGGDTIVFPSGMSAAAGILTSLLKPGDTILLPSDGYAPVRFYTEQYLVKFGVKLKTIPTQEIDNFDFSGIDLALLETPSNPMLDTFDIQGVAAKIHKSGGLLAIDNTTLTFLGQQPLALGADISMSADTKAVNGHSDVVFGHVACTSQALSDKIRQWRKFSGNIPGPMETWLVHRSLSTLDVRLQRMCDTAMLLAQALYEHPKVKSVRYPGLPKDPSYNIAKTQQQLFGFIISFELDSKCKADAFLKACSLVYEATSFGGVHSTAERRARWGTDNIAPGVVRFSVGCERADDLIYDVMHALKQL
ncbi:cystathionine beta-lyase metC [Glaciecola punicea ACAM 611]|uniref:Cystathionine beta-lyase metC n=1 Tax=Glaciecola punicea ACAM 611 TaxID=1121923 RepID=H5TC21_9ALTE|nr:cystathionine gamma-lyase [Glaciecola punicea]GAB55848.1 cystathionine beta-lyase metC [Glaciecola punicea ACAM 611]